MKTRYAAHTFAKAATARCNRIHDSARNVLTRCNALQDLLYACAASLGRAQRGRVVYYVSSDTPEEAEEKAAELLGWSNILHKVAHFNELVKLCDSEVMKACMQSMHI